MREIKFRVWDKEEKKMLSEKDRDFDNLLITLHDGLTYLEEGCADEDGRGRR